MTRSILVITSAVLALFSPLAQAKVKDELRTYVFTSGDCNGPTIGGNKDIKLNKCHNIVSGANSIRAFTNKHQDWIANINNGVHQCYINTYQYLGCQGTPTAVEELPHAIDECITSDNGEQILSMLFGCRPKKSDPEEPEVITETKSGYLTTWMHTSNSLTTIVSSVMITSTKTLLPTTTVTVMPASTVTVFPPPLNPVQTVTVLPPPVSPAQIVTIQTLPDPTHTVTVYVEDNSQSRMRRSDLQAETHDLEPRKNKWKGPRIGVWMKHPWSQAVICYECYAKSADNMSKFECRSGPNNPIHCKGPMPDSQNTITVTHTPDITVTVGQPITSVSVVTVTAGQASPVPLPVTTQSVYTLVDGDPIWSIIDQSVQTVTLNQKEADLDPRNSFHRAVRFTHPWYPGQEMCADAEWEGRGKDRGEIRIQKPRSDMKKCNKDHQVQYIDAYPKTSTYELPTRTVSMVISTSTVYPAPIVTVNPAPPMLTVTTVFGPEPDPPTVITTIDPAPAYTAVTTITIDAEPPCSTVTVVPGFAPTSYTTIYADRRQLRDL